MTEASRYFGEAGRPQIYAYTEPHYKGREWTGGRPGRGLLKVGYTSRAEVLDRIWEQFPTKKADEKPFELVFREDAVDAAGRFFKDHQVHQRLEAAGVTRLNGEWFECTLEELRTCVTEIRAGKALSLGRHQTFGMRPEQEAAVQATAAYFRSFPKASAGKPPHFLWNAKMRFGKTFTTYQLAKRMGWKRILVLTFKPAVQSAWKEDLASHVDFADWQFIGQGDGARPIDPDAPLVWFASFQDMLGRAADGSIKPKFQPCYGIEWDCVVLDEYHFGSWREGAKELYIDDREDLTGLDELGQVDETTFPLSVKNYLYLSGTPFRALQNGEFTEEQIFNWTYTDEQRAKSEWPESAGKNPYEELPQLIMMTYQVPEAIRSIALQGEFNEFNLNEFFKAAGTGSDAKFLHQEQVSQWLSLIRGQYLPQAVAAMKDGVRPPLPFEDTRLQRYLNHTLWFLPSVAACEAMANLLKAPQHTFFHEYQVVVAAGSRAGMGAAALAPVKKAMGNPLSTKSITLSCGKLTTGVSVPPWSGIFMLRSLESPESYFQAAFRVQTPWVLRGQDPLDPNGTEILKRQCYVFDFAPTRALRLISDYSGKLDADETVEAEKRVEEFIQFLPVLCYDGYRMYPLNAGQLLDIVVSGTASSMLARRFQSAQLVNLDTETLARLKASPDVVAALERIEAFRNLNKQLDTVIASEKALKEKKSAGKTLTADDQKTKKENQSWRQQLREQLLKFVTRIPVFMYLTDAREVGLKDVIENIEPGLFTRVTGLSLQDFRTLCDLDVFNRQNLNSAIFAFKNYEEASLSYAGNSKVTTVYGGWDTTLSRDEAVELVRSFA
jgi:hypothetical protein